MQRTTWLLLLTLTLPTTHPMRAQAVEALSERLAQQYQAARDDEEAEA